MADKIDMEGEFGQIKVERSDFCGAEQVQITTENWPECAQDCTMTRDQFKDFVDRCTDLLKRWPKATTE